MDLMAHALYGATLCSRTGLAGGAAGARGRRGIADWTVWCAALFGVLPDIVSMGPAFVAFGQTEALGHFFRDFDGPHLVLYRYMHSLLVALAAAGLLRLAWRPLGVPALAWTVHLVMDALTHGTGKFQTMLFYPLSTWALDGIRWWRHPGLVLAYWALLPGLWLSLRRWRRQRWAPNSHVGPSDSLGARPRAAFWQRSAIRGPSRLDHQAVREASSGGPACRRPRPDAGAPRASSRPP
jgi:hypothetical protein